MAVMPAPPRPIPTSAHARIAHDFYATPAFLFAD
jgi:hypothetical protein